MEEAFILSPHLKPLERLSTWLKDLFELPNYFYAPVY